MTFDPNEGVGPDNLITTGVHAGRIPATYKTVITRVVSRLASLDDDILAIYLYGSVATGMATPPTSDLDLLAVLSKGRAEPMVRDIATELSEQHRDLVREVAIGTVLISDIWTDSVNGLGNRCFLKHYCVHLYGLDICQDVEPCRATAEVAWAFNHDIGEAVTSARTRLSNTTSPSQVSEISKAIARRVTLAATSLVSIADKTWTTDRETAARSIAKLYPGRGPSAETALRWCVAPSGNTDEVREFVDGFASWLAGELKRLYDAP